MATATSSLPPGVAKNFSSLSEDQQALVQKLCALGQSHLFETLADPTETISPAVRRQLLEQLTRLDEGYPGGLEGYIENARALLENSRKGVNPLEGWEPNLPQGERFEIGTAEYNETEALGLKELGRVGFVLVAGGLGERLGYSNIKVGLPTEMATETCYLQYYIEYILAVQTKYGDGIELPLCIMTSGDTNERTQELLRKKNYFGMKEDQITIVQQGEGVPALVDNNATIAIDPEVAYQVLTKPHGHGDIHALLHKHGVAKSWVQKGVKWLSLFQDTNGLAFHTLPLTLGVSVKLDLIMNSLAVPRKAKQAIGGITKLVNTKTGQVRTINVEYNQLDPLLRATGNPDGDVNDKETGFSPYPGNINQLLFQLEPYEKVLDRTSGIMPEFVNPKYKDETKTAFKKPTRLECMMQDFPTVLTEEESKRVGFTSISADLCFSPVKNATADGEALQNKGTAPGVAATGEADQYGAVRKILKSIGCQIEEAEPEYYEGIHAVLGPAIVFKPNFVCCPAEYKAKFPHPEKVKISSRSSLVVNGSGVTIESLDLDGALVIDCEEGKTLTIKDEVVKNEGWVRCEDRTSSDEVIKMRGYRLERRDTKKIILRTNGGEECAIV